jgi:hypothetical protein
MKMEIGDEKYGPNQNNTKKDWKEVNFSMLLGLNKSIKICIAGRKHLIFSIISMVTDTYCCKIFQVCAE